MYVYPLTEMSLLSDRFIYAAKAVFGSGLYNSFPKAMVTQILIIRFLGAD